MEQEIYARSESFILEIFSKYPEVQNLMSKLSRYNRQAYIHGVNTANLTYKIGCMMHEDMDMVEKQTIAALLHDIGYLDISTDILCKVGAIEQKEFYELKKHTVYGYNIAKSIMLPEECQTMILQHHERRGGSGYPNKVEPKEYVYPVMVADVFSALIEPRSTREPYTKEGAFSFIEWMEDEFSPESMKALGKVIFSGGF